MYNCSAVKCCMSLFGSKSLSAGSSAKSLGSSFQSRSFSSGALIVYYWGKFVFFQTKNTYNYAMCVWNDLNALVWMFCFHLNHKIFDREHTALYKIWKITLKMFNLVILSRSRLLNNKYSTRIDFFANPTFSRNVPYRIVLYRFAKNSSFRQKLFGFTKVRMRVLFCSFLIIWI